MNQTFTRRTDCRLDRQMAAFEIRDNKNRQLGLDVALWECTYTVEDRPNWGGYSHEPGTVYCVTAQQMRNGEWYGSIQQGKEFATLNEARRYYETIVAKREKEYAKKYIAA